MFFSCTPNIFIPGDSVFMLFQCMCNNTSIEKKRYRWLKSKASTRSNVYATHYTTIPTDKKQDELNQKKRKLEDVYTTSSFFFVSITLILKCVFSVFMDKKLEINVWNHLKYYCFEKFWRLFFKFFCCYIYLVLSGWVDVNPSRPYNSLKNILIIIIYKVFLKSVTSNSFLAGLDKAVPSSIGSENKENYSPSKSDRTSKQPPPIAPRQRKAGRCDVSYLEFLNWQFSFFWLFSYILSIFSHYAAVVKLIRDNTKAAKHKRTFALHINKKTSRPSPGVIHHTIQADFIQILSNFYRKGLFGDPKCN